MADNMIRDRLAADLIAALDDHLDHGVGCCDDHDAHPLALEGVLDATVPAGHLLDKGWRPPARVIVSTEELDALDWPCVVREIPPEGEFDPYPPIWEKTFQTDGWARAGAMHRVHDCTPRLPVEVLVGPAVDRG